MSAYPTYPRWLPWILLCGYQCLAYKSLASNSPDGLDRSVTINEDSTYQFTTADFGFSDAADIPPDSFHSVTIPALPTRGVLAVDGLPVSPGESIPRFPVHNLMQPLETPVPFSSVACSADGTRMLAKVANEVSLYRSPDSGITWLPVDSQVIWHSIASSGDGIKWFATTIDGGIGTSLDSGATWSVKPVAGSGERWRQIVSSGDGLKLAAIGSMGRIAVSQDGGITWSLRESVRQWLGIRASEDGNLLVANASDTKLYFSADAGLTWTSRNFDSQIAGTMTPDGSLYTAVSEGDLFLSTDRGMTWTRREDTPYWLSIMTLQGGDLMYGILLGNEPHQMAVSRDRGQSWTFYGPFRRWSPLCTTADGSKMLSEIRISDTVSQLVRSTAAVPSLTFSPVPDSHGAAYAQIPFQVQDNGPAGSNLDPVANQFTFAVNPVGDAPVVAATIAPLIAPVGAPFNFVIPSGIFTDPDGPTNFTYAASLPDGSSLPSWLTLDPVAGRFMGTPGAGDKKTSTIRLTALDDSNPPLSASLIFTLTVPHAAPVGTDGSVSILEDTSYTFAPADFGFTDPEDVPPNRFTSFRIMSLPAVGSLTLDSVPVSTDTIVPLYAVPREIWVPGATNRYWAQVDCSADGKKMIAGDFGNSVEPGGRLYISSDAGLTWAPAASTQYWSAVASSADGSILLATGRQTALHVSHDGGLTWSPRDTRRDWVSVDMSSDGGRMVAVTNSDNGYGGRIYISSDSGSTWFPRQAPYYWREIKCSANGRIIAAIGMEKAQISRDGGTTWSLLRDESLSNISMSDDGTVLLACQAGRPLLLSRDSGLSWVQTETARMWTGVMTSGNGQILAATAEDRIFTSNDGGASFTRRSQSGKWSSLASSTNGQFIVAADRGNGSGGRIYTSQSAIPELVFRAAPDAFGSPYAQFNFRVQDDGVGGNQTDPASRTMLVRVEPVNDAPVLRSPVSDARPRERTLFNFNVSSNTFLDADPGTVLNYTARLSDGRPLPAWLSFNPATRLFTGTPNAGDVTVLEITLTASDDASPPLSASDTFIFQITPIDDPPAGTDWALTLPRGSEYTFQPSDFGFNDPSDVPPHQLTRILLPALPNAGTLSINGAPASAGAFASIGLPLPGMVWTARESTRSWRQIAMSSDGMKLAATVTNGQIYTSSNGGISWTARETNRSWRSIASSADGSVLAAGVGTGQIYVSTDSGSTWTPRESSRLWRSIAMSSDGTRLAAVDTSSSRIYLSVDGGASWNTSGPSADFYDVCLSSDGRRMAGVVRDGPIYTSNNAGLTWVMGGSNLNWRSVACSSDGLFIAAIVENGFIFTSSDGGLKWYPREISRAWSDIAVSPDGNLITAVAQNDRIYLSTDKGISWRPRAVSRQWNSICLSADGTRFAATVSLGQIFTSEITPASRLTYRPPSGSAGGVTTNFTFQVEDDGAAGSNLDLSPNTVALTFSADSAFEAWADLHGLPRDPTANQGRNLLTFAFGTNPGDTSPGSAGLTGGVISYGDPTVVRLPSAPSNPYALWFSLRRNAGLTATTQFSSDLISWEAATGTPSVIASDNAVDLFQQPFRAQMSNGEVPRYSRLRISTP